MLFEETNFILRSVEQINRDPTHPLHGISPGELIELMKGYEEWLEG